MRRILKRRPSPSMVVALIALVVAMTGTGYAAITLPNNSVGSKQLKTNAVTAKKIKNGAVNSKKVKNGSLTGTDVKDKSLTPSDFNGSVQGPKGDTGAQGVPGTPGPPGTDGTDGLDGTARAYGEFQIDGTPVAARSKGIVSVSHGLTGIYCVLLDPSIDVTTVAPIASGLVSPGASTDVVGATAGGCTSNAISGILVIVQDPAGTNVNGPFNLAVP